MQVYNFMLKPAIPIPGKKHYYQLDSIAVAASSPEEAIQIAAPYIRPGQSLLSFYCTFEMNDPYIKTLDVKTEHTDDSVAAAMNITHTVYNGQ